MANILIVDDSRIFRNILKNVLSGNGHTIIAEAANGAEALKLLETNQPDLITLDITMPVMDGLETMKKIHSDYPAIKVIMVSAAGQKMKVMEALKSGASDFLQKPFQPDTVISVVNKLI